MKRWALGVVCCVSLGAAASPVRADAVSYNRVVDLEAAGDTFVVRHHHDWSAATAKARAAMMTTHQDPFTADNSYASVSWHSREGSKALRTVPSPALTWLGVTADSRYVVGLSTVKISNPYQAVVWDRSGRLLMSRHITPTVACLTPAQFGTIRAQHAAQLALLKKDRSWRDRERVYVDYDGLSPREHAGLWNALQPHDCAPFSASFSESVTNWIYWYDAKDPGAVVVEVEEGGVPTGLRLRDLKGRLFTLPFRLETP